MLENGFGWWGWGGPVRHLTALLAGPRQLIIDSFSHGLSSLLLLFLLLLILLLFLLLLQKEIGM
jgi:hypothetical protein